MSVPVVSVVCCLSMSVSVVNINFDCQTPFQHGFE
jgi:hypothetical protein